MGRERVTVGFDGGVGFWCLPGHGFLGTANSQFGHWGFSFLLFFLGFLFREKCRLDLFSYVQRTYNAFIIYLFKIFKFY